MLELFTSVKLAFTLQKKKPVYKIVSFILLKLMYTIITTQKKLSRQFTQFGTLENPTIGISLQYMMWQVSNILAMAFSA